MGVLKQGQVETTTGLKPYRPPICIVCGERKEGEIYSRTPNGEPVCPTCAGSHQRALLESFEVEKK